MRFLLLIIVLIFSGCIKQTSLFPSDINREKPIPAEWEEQEQVILKDSTTIYSHEGDLIHERVLWNYYPGKRRMPSSRFLTGYSSVSEKPLSIECTAFYPNGKQWTLMPGSAQTYSYQNEETRTIVGGNSKMYSFEIPDFKAGTIVRYKIIRTYKYAEFADAEYFRSSAPTLEKVITIDTNSITPVFNNSEKLKVSQSSLGSNKIYRADTLDAILSGSILRHPEEWFAAVHLTTNSSAAGWNSIGSFYLDLIKDSVVINEPKQVLSKSESLAIIEHTFHDVTSSIRYMLYLDSVSAIVPWKTTSVEAQGVGDCKGMSNLLSYRLREKSIPAGMALVQTEGFQSPANAPSMSNFDHVVVWCVVEDDTLFLDPTNTQSSWYNSAWSLIDRNALIMAPGNSSYRVITPDERFKNDITTESKIMVISKDSIIQKGSVKLSGLSATGLFSLHQEVNYHKDELFNNWFENNFAFTPDSARIEHISFDSVHIQYEQNITSQYAAIDKGGIRLKIPSTFRGRSGYTTYEPEGYYAFIQMNQNDSWELPGNFIDFDPTTIEDKVVTAKTSKQKNIVHRQFKLKQNHAVPYDMMRGYFTAKKKLNKMIIWK